MSKLKLAKAVRNTFTVAKWVGISGAGIIVAGLLWWWATSHFLSFGIVIGVIGAFFGLAGILEAWDWSQKIIEEAEQEESEAQARGRAEKRRQELREQMPSPRPFRTIPDFDNH